MTVKNSRGEWVCTYCLKTYKHPNEADDCYEKHDVVLVPLARPDLARLIQFIYLKNDDLLTPMTLNILNRYNKLRPK